MTAPGRHVEGAPAPYSLTEHATLMSGGGFAVRCNDPDIEQVYPLAEWITNTSSKGTVYRRKVIVLEDWHVVTAPPEAS